MLVRPLKRRGCTRCTNSSKVDFRVERQYNMYILRLFRVQRGVHSVGNKAVKQLENNPASSITLYDVANLLLKTPVALRHCHVRIIYLRPINSHQSLQRKGITPYFFHFLRVKRVD